MKIPIARLATLATKCTEKCIRRAGIRPACERTQHTVVMLAPVC